MTQRRTLLCLPLALSILAGTALAEGEKKDDLQWQKGPAKVRIGDQAELNLPEGYAFADEANTRKFLERNENIVSGNELGTVIPLNGGWFAIYEFDKVGYVKDDEKAKLDADAIFESIRKGTEESNEERKSRGWDELHITGWIDPPHYDDVTHQLTWSLVGKASDGQFANYRTRLLGRRGVMSVELVASPQKLAGILPEFRTAATNGYHFTDENRYSAFVQGDKVAEYGLTALIVGGAAAAAVKTGLFKYLLKLLIVGWKLVLVAFAALAGTLKKLFQRKPKAPAVDAASSDITAG